MIEREYLVIRNGSILTPDKELKDGVLVIQGSKIVDVGRRGTIQEPINAAVIDAGGHYVIPGLIDIHVHGSKGASALDGSREALATMSRFFATRGVTSFVATLSTSPASTLLPALEGIRSVKRNGNLPGAEVLGVHQEGPYLNPLQKGAHPEVLLMLPTPERYQPYLEYRDVLMMMTIAPELPGATELIRTLRDAGVVAAAGHTDGIDRDVEEAIEVGLSHTVHCFCNMSTLRRDNLKRVAGVVETVLYDDRLTTELIGDGWHVGDSLMKLAIKVKGVDRVCWVTDAMPAAGMPPGRYAIGQIEAIVEHGIARLPDNSAYAGSVTTLDTCLRRGVQSLGLRLTDSVRMATLTPAQIVGVDDRKGSLEPGKDADVVIIDGNLEIDTTIRRGQVSYRKSHLDFSPISNCRSHLPDDC